MRKHRGYKKPIKIDMNATHFRPCKCNKCGYSWTEKRPGPGYINGFDFFDYCDKCVDKKEKDEAKAIDAAMRKFLKVNDISHIHLTCDDDKKVQEILKILDK